MTINIDYQRSVRIYTPTDAPPWWNPDGATPAAVTGAWRAKGATSQAASYLNLGLLGYTNIDPAATGVGVAPTWSTSLGWICDGATQYLSTGIVVSSGYSALIQFVSTRGGPNWDRLFGSYRYSATTWFVAIPWAPGNVVYYGNGTLVSRAPQLTSGNLAIAGAKGYRNGIDDGVTIGAFSGFNDKAVYIAQQNPLDVPFMGQIHALMITSVTLTAPQVMARVTAMAAL